MFLFQEQLSGMELKLITCVSILHFKIPIGLFSSVSVLQDLVTLCWVLVAEECSVRGVREGATRDVLLLWPGSAGTPGALVARSRVEDTAALTEVDTQGFAFLLLTRLLECRWDRVTEITRLSAKADGLTTDVNKLALREADWEYNWDD